MSNTTNWIIVTDNNCDLPLDYYKKNNVAVLPLSYRFGDTEYISLSKNDLTPAQFYAKLKAGETANTSMVTVESFKKVFLDAIQEGNDILYIGFSSALSGTFNSAKLAAEEILEDKRITNRIIVIDSLSASLGQGMIVDTAVEMKKNGESITTVANYLEDTKLDYCHLFTVDDLNHLYRGGRVSKATAFLGTMIGIKPLLHMNDEGKLIPIGKVRGRKQSLENLAKMTVENMQKQKSKKIFISHCDCLDDAKFVAAKIKELSGISCSMINYVSASIGAHSGPGTVAIFFIGNGRTVN